VARRSQFLAAAVALAGLPITAPGTQASSTIPHGSVRISNERTLTSWGTPARIGAIRAAPDAKAKPVGRLRWFTEDGFPEVYIALRRYKNRWDNTWLRIRIPGRPNGRTGWVPKRALEPLERVRTMLVLNKRQLRVRLYRRGHRIFSAPVGIGAPGTPTPSGKFWIREKFPTKNPRSLYGPFAVGTSAYSSLSEWPGGGVVGLHGTNQPQLVPGRPSHGCIRLHNADIRRLVRLLPVGTPFRIG
jgi:L,D-transpeptidase-like protein